MMSRESYLDNSTSGTFMLMVKHFLQNEAQDLISETIVIVILDTIPTGPVGQVYHVSAILSDTERKMLGCFAPELEVGRCKMTCGHME